MWTACPSMATCVGGVGVNAENSRGEYSLACAISPLCVFNARGDIVALAHKFSIISIALFFNDEGRYKGVTFNESGSINAISSENICQPLAPKNVASVDFPDPDDAGNNMALPFFTTTEE